MQQVARIKYVFTLQPKGILLSATHYIFVAFPAVAKAINQPLRGQLLDFPRQALHAASLAFKHPRTGRPLSFEAAVPADMQRLIQDIEAYSFRLLTIR